MSAKIPIRIFVASAGDLPNERRNVENIINQLNKFHNHLFFDTVKWETDIPSGRYDKRIQDRINEELETSNVLLFLINKRIGAFSLEEYKLAVKKGKKVFVYFRKNPQVDISKEEEILNLQKIVAFRKELEKENRVLFYEFENEDKLENKIQKDLNLYFKEAYPPVTDWEPNPILTQPTPPKEDFAASVSRFVKENRKWMLWGLGGLLGFILLLDVFGFIRTYKGMVKVPAGEYFIGKQEDDSKLLDILYANKEELYKSPNILDCKSEYFTVFEGFYFSKYEVTQGEYMEFLDTLKEQGLDYKKHLPVYFLMRDTAVNLQSRNPAGYETIQNMGKSLVGDNRPVIGVSYSDAQAYAEWKGMDLPDAGQWEIAARSMEPDSQTLYPWGESFEIGICNTFESNSGAIYQVNVPDVGITNGIYGLIGNADEWIKSEKSVEAEVRGGHYDGKGALLGIIHNKRYIQKNLDDKLKYFYQGIRLVVPESRATDIDTRNMVYFEAKDYKIGYDIKSPLLKVLQQIDASANEIFNSVIFKFDPGTKREFKSGYYIDKYETSFEEYNQFLAHLEANPSERLSSVDYSIVSNIRNNEQLYAPNLPVVGISWEAATEYAKWREKSLPTFEQMSLAISGPENFLYPWGNSWCQQCCNDKNFKPAEESIFTLPVDEFLMDEETKATNASWCGAYHLVGNVKEYLSDLKVEEGVEKGTMMGSSWAEDGRIFGLNFYYGKAGKELRSEYVGFRCVKPSPSRFTWKLYEFLFYSFL